MSELLVPASQRAAFAAGRFLRVVNWHNTPATDRARLRAELAWYAARFDPVRPEHLDRFVETGDWGLDRPGVALCFYDAYLNHVTVAAPVLEELGLTGWFLPPTGALDVPAEEQRAYADAHDIGLLPDEPDAPWLMTWDDLARISERHVVAAHTAHHSAAVDIRTDEDAEREIHEPVRRLTEVTGTVPPAFAFLHGTVPVAGTTAGDAVLSSGVRWAITNTAYVRIAD
ncbi:polysaccharide deacetylase family protein [Nocardioides sp. zg-1308]|uniref:Polysaccharide deacetylase family protein n=1 Tax=Nocardioides renjunii TaxID=3095075 RepID=A0ABU5K9S4_9ACTN|nr:polysaccharide deacetylase family protein [Nocardioides sp. S-58]MDZ5661725.1 polysaccharide deacetylase family protein [Nocardioides sp. S-58]NPD06573.1 polysaccharide deacetylase family protein [Nocardioides sp. zg-1308]